MMIELDFAEPERKWLPGRDQGAAAEESDAQHDQDERHYQTRSSCRRRTARRRRRNQTDAGKAGGFNEPSVASFPETFRLRRQPPRLAVAQGPG